MITAALAAWIPTLTFAALPARARVRAKLAIFDACGTVLAGVHHPAVQHLRQLILDMGSAPQARLPGDTLRASVLDAAWLTGTMAEAYLYSDTHFPSHGHFTSVLLPVLLALADTCEVNGPEALTAYTVGFEVATRLAAAVTPSHYQYGWNPTAVAGVLGATATAGRLLSLSPEQLQHALGIATSEAAGSRCNVGSDTMPLHSGRAARSGVLSALLARRGFTADVNALEMPLGWLALFRGEGSVQAEHILTGLGQDFALERPELSFKLYANGASTHRFIDAVLSLRAQGVTADQVQRLLCSVSSVYNQTLHDPPPSTAQQARLSLPYAVAVALCDGEVGLRQFNQSRVQAADVQALMQRVVVQEDPALSATERVDFMAFPATVQVQLLDGRVLTATVEHAHGSPQHPPRRPEFEAKFRQCAKDVLSSEQTLLAMRYLYQLETLPAWRQVLDALSLAGTGA